MQDEAVMVTDNSAGLTLSDRRPERSWVLKPAAPAEYFASLAEMGYSALTAQLLYSREMHTPEQIEYYFKADYCHLSDPFLIKDMDRTVARIIRAEADNELTAIYGDFDVDGVTACSLLMQYLG